MQTNFFQSPDDKNSHQRKKDICQRPLAWTCLLLGALAGGAFLLLWLAVREFERQEKCYFNAGSQTGDVEEIQKTFRACMNNQ